MGLTVGLPVRQRLEAAERSGQFPHRRAEGAGLVVDLREHGDHQQPAGRQPRQERRVERGVAEPLADENVVGAVASRRQPEVEVVTEGSHSRHARERGQPHRGDVHRIDGEAPLGQPPRHGPSPTRHIERPPTGRQQVEPSAQGVGRQRPHRFDGGVPRVPATSVLFGHGGHRRPGSARRRPVGGSGDPPNPLG